MDQTQEYIAFAILLAGFLMLISRVRQERLLQVVMVSYGFFAVLVLVLPKLAASVIMVEGEFSPFHEFLFRNGAVAILGLVLSIYLNHTSIDAFTRVVLFFGLAIISTLEVFIYSLAPHIADKGKGVTFKEPRLGLYTSFATAAGAYLVVFLAKDFFGHSQLHSRLNMHLKIDFVMNLVHGVVAMAYPKVLVGFLTKAKSCDEFIVVCTQCYGAFLIGSGVISLLYTSALFTINKRQHLMCRVLETLGAVVLMLATNFLTDALPGSTQPALLMLCLVSFNALLGYYSPHETEGYVSKNKD